MAAFCKIYQNYFEMVQSYYQALRPTADNAAVHSETAECLTPARIFCYPADPAERCVCWVQVTSVSVL